MQGYQPETYGELWAETYDATYSNAPSEMIEFLGGLAGVPPRALELAVGTGRVAISLAGSGVAVSGIDISKEMLARLASKPGGDKVDATLGNMASFKVDRPFPLVYLPFNTFFALIEQQDQISCFKSVARALEPAGRFVVEGFVPDLYRYAPLGEKLRVVSIDSTTEHTYELATINPLTQRIDVHVVKRHVDGTSSVLPVSMRYCWPQEMDLMAKMAGLELENRWAWYDRSPLDTNSRQQVSVYRKS